MDPNKTLQTIRQCTANERLEFVMNAWDQLVEDGWQPEPTDEWITELDRRLRAHEADPTNVRTWEQVVQHARKAK